MNPAKKKTIHRSFKFVPGPVTRWLVAHLSPRAKVVWDWLSSHVDGWLCTVEQIAEWLSVTKQTIYRALNELETLACLKRDDEVWTVLLPGSTGPSNKNETRPSNKNVTPRVVEDRGCASARSLSGKDQKNQQTTRAEEETLTCEADRSQLRLVGDTEERNTEDVASATLWSDREERGSEDKSNSEEDEVVGESKAKKSKKSKRHPDAKDWWPDASSSKVPVRERLMVGDLIKRFKRADPSGGRGLWGQTALVQYLCHFYDRRTLLQALEDLAGFPDVRYPVKFFCRHLEKLTGAVETTKSGAVKPPTDDESLSPPGETMSWGERMRAWHESIDDIRIAARVAGEHQAKRLEWLERKDIGDEGHVYNVRALFALRDEVGGEQ